MFQNSRIVESDSNLNEQAESAWNEIQTAFGSSKGGGGDVSAPVQFISVDLGGALKHIETKNTANANKDQEYSKSSET